MQDPHRLLGFHEGVIRLWRPGAQKISLEVLGKIVEASCVDQEGLFEYHSDSPLTFLDYRIYHPNGALGYDPYAFPASLSEFDVYLLKKGCHYEIYRVLGAQFQEIQGIRGIRFAVWAPNARSVFLVADFNHWKGKLYPLKNSYASGIWELFIPGLTEGEKYKFEIHTQEGYFCLKSDPVAFYSELRPKTASITAHVYSYPWKDGAWMSARSKRDLNIPMTIYEVHLGSWRYLNQEGEFPNYRILAVHLASYCLEMGFTHVELLPIMEHPLDESWGYQVSGFYAVTSRYGTPSDFQYFVDYLHQKGIGVILDWVPAHFPIDEYSLSRFDGTALYEYEDPRKGMHPHWQTAIFNYSRSEVSNFLLGSALFWIDVMHIDGLRVDAVASLIYLDYGRKEGEWIPNADGSHYNREAIELLKHLNSIVHDRFPGVLMIAEESSAYQGVTHQQGLGFDLKWNMGWMNDTLCYFARNPIYRKFHQNELTFSLLYVFSEKFMCVLSHDEVVHGKGSLLSKMPGPDWQKFANIRLLYSYAICHPGKKLLFMGGEIGQWKEWDCKGYLEWDLLKYPLHQGLHQMVKKLNHFYMQQSSLWERDFIWEGYEWVDFADTDHSVISYLRKSPTSCLLCIHHFTPEYIPHYLVRLKNLKKATEIFNTDAACYGGSDTANEKIPITSEGMIIALSPLATMVFEVHFA